MSIASATSQASVTRGPLERTGSGTVRRLLPVALAVGATWGIALAVVMVGFTTTDDGKPFQHTADYWLTALGLPLVCSATVVVHSVHRRAAGLDGRRGRVGAMLFVLPMLLFAGIFIQGLVTAENSSWGPTYLLCVLVSDIAIGLLVSGLWSAQVLPRWVLALWFAGWFVGGPLSPPFGSLLHTAAYAVLAAQLLRGTETCQALPTP